MSSHRIRLADERPPYCASCHNPQVGQRFVSFDAAYDGPAFAQGVNGLETDVVGGGPITSDDLAICEDCIRLAAAQVGLGDVTQAEHDATELQGALERLSDRLAVQDEHIANLERAALSRASLEATMKPPEKPPSSSRPRARAKTRG